MKFETAAIHAGQKPDPATGAVITPIYQTSTFAFESAGNPHRDIYSRVSNPTRTALESCLAALEHGRHGFAFSSGMAAETTLLELFGTETGVILHHELYGGTYRLFSQATAGRRYRVDYVDVNNRAALRKALVKEVKLVWIETPTNPMMTIVDIAKTAKLVHNAGALLVVDNTFTSPYFLNPLDLGADFALHSLTKYINGHSDALGGGIVTNHDEWAEKLRFLQKSLGTNAAPFDSFLILRGAKTLAARMRIHHRNALEIARFLAKHPKVETVLHPGLPSHPQYRLAKKQMRGFGGTFSFRLKTDVAGIRRFLDRFELIILAESLGGVESLIEHPWSMTHASMPPEFRRASGLTENLIRLSAGIEHIDDLIADLEHALKGV